MMPSMLVKACGFSIFGQIFLSFWEKKTGKLHNPPSNYPKKTLGTIFLWLQFGGAQGFGTKWFHP